MIVGLIDGFLMVRQVPDAGPGIKSVCVVGIFGGHVLQPLQGRLACRGRLGLLKKKNAGSARLWLR